MLLNSNIKWLNKDVISECRGEFEFSLAARKSFIRLKKTKTSQKFNRRCWKVSSQSGWISSSNYVALRQTFSARFYFFWCVFPRNCEMFVTRYRKTINRQQKSITNRKKLLCYQLEQYYSNNLSRSKQQEKQNEGKLKAKAISATRFSPKQFLFRAVNHTVSIYESIDLLFDWFANKTRRGCCFITFYRFHSFLFLPFASRLLPVIFPADESLTCNVCDRAFRCHRQLASHQQKKRHFG